MRQFFDKIETDLGTLNISIDADNFDLYVNDHKTTLQLNFPTREKDYLPKVELLEKMGIETPKELRDCYHINPKPLNDFFTKRLGPLFNKRMASVCYKAFIEPLGRHASYVQRFSGAGRFAYYVKDLMAINAVIPLLNQAEKDGIGNVSPIIIALQKSPAELREFFGKGLWKKIANSSASQNKRISWMLSYFAKKELEDHALVKICTIEFLKAKAWQQTYWMQRYDFSPKNRLHLLHWLRLNAKTAIRQNEYNLRTYRQIDKPSEEGFKFFNDACSMAARMGVPLRIPTTLNATKAWHDELVRDMNNLSMARYSKDRFKTLPFVEDSILVKLNNGENANVEFLTSPYMFAMESATMRHCIADKIDMVITGKYVAAHISTPQGVATAAWRVSDKVALNEIRSRFNDIAPDDCIEAAKQVTKFIANSYRLPAL